MALTPTPTSTPEPTFTGSTPVALTPTPTSTPEPTPTLSCECYDFNVDIKQIDLDNASGNTDPLLDRTVFIEYAPCGSDIPTTVSYNVAGIFIKDICVFTPYISNMIIYFYQNDIQISVGLSSDITNTNDCCS